MPSIDCLSLIDKGICQADCCGYVPIPVTTWNQYRHLAAVQPVEVLRNDDIVMVDTGKSDIKCVFLDRQTLRCNIYHVRPNPCRLFGLESHDDLLGCPYAKEDGSLRTRAERRRYSRLLKKDIDRILQKAKRYATMKGNANEPDDVRRRQPPLL